MEMNGFLDKPRRKTKGEVGRVRKLRKERKAVT